MQFLLFSSLFVLADQRPLACETGLDSLFAEFTKRELCKHQQDDHFPL